MKKLFTLMLLAGAMLTSAQLKAQDIVKGDLAFLKGEKNINFSFQFDKLTVGEEGKEANYIKKKKAEKDAKEPGKGDEWEKAWLDDRDKHYKPRFMQLFCKYAEMEASEDSSAKYTLIVNTKFIEPGYYAGVKNGPAILNLEITIPDPANPKKVLCKITMDDLKGGKGQITTGLRVGEAYAKAGKELGRLVAKKAK
jgi:hypothetical protein